jgi:hypothetical protein
LGSVGPTTQVEATGWCGAEGVEIPHDRHHGHPGAGPAAAARANGRGPARWAVSWCGGRGGQRLRRNSRTNPIARPAYSVLKNANLRSLGLNDLHDWRDALKDYLVDRKLATKEA